MGREKFKRLFNIERECYKCGSKIYYRGFYRKASIWNVPNGLEKKIIEEIWENPIFILQCCYCFAGVDYTDIPISFRNTIERFEKLVNKITKNKKRV